MTFSKFKNYLIIPAAVFILSACSYSFTGASVPPHISTIAIPIAQDRTGFGEAELSDLFTTALQTKFLEDNTLQITDRDNADALLECTITSINDQPAIISGNEQINARKITISAKVVYKDLVMKKVFFDKNFSNFGQYTNDGDVVASRKQAIEQAIEQITEDILIGVVSNW